MNGKWTTPADRRPCHVHCLEHISGHVEKGSDFLARAVEDLTPVPFDTWNTHIKDTVLNSEMDTLATAIGDPNLRSYSDRIEWVKLPYYGHGLAVPLVLCHTSENGPKDSPCEKNFDEAVH